MACALTQGYSWAGCDGGPGGIIQIGFSELSNKSGAGSSVPTVTGGVITAWTLATGKVFRKYDVRPETAFFTDNATKDPKTGAYSYAPTVNLTLATLDTTMRQEILLLLQNNLMVITKDNSGVYRLAGYNYGMMVNTATGESGTALQDGRKQVINLVGSETIPMYEVQDSLIATLMP